MLVLWFRPAHASESERVIATDIVNYVCTTTASGDTQTVSVQVTLTMPTSATAGQQLTIGWRGVYAQSTSLMTPATGLPEGTKLYAYAGISDFSGLTSATGVGTIDATTPGEAIALPAAQVNLATTPGSAGTGTVRPAAINFGASPTSPSIECEAENREDLTTYTLTVTDTGGSPTPDPDDSTSPTPDDEETDESDEPEETPSEETTTETPSGAAETGAGGTAGPDGRTFILTGSVLILASVTGLALRRRRTHPHTPRA
ncbi:hypothetical protein ACFOY2_12600 [Nonomuraea purpurea]|uniref:LPXTG cell wall anchor domain-containing protein n=1 Tax=Nonomuraea purpurea TaxID=1849276 RepID=A0ABV8G637_9ACTN